MITTKWLMHLVLLLALGIVINLNHRLSGLAHCQAMNGLDGDPNAVVGGYYKPGITAAQILRARGFLSEEFFITTEDNYILSIIRARNPLINNGQGALPGKEPVLFIHGVLTSAALWVLNSRGAKPKDLTNIQVNSSSIEELIEQLKDEPSGFSAPILLMNFGYEIWLLNRRGTLESENRVGSEDRTIVDAINAIVPTLIGGGFPTDLSLMQPGEPGNSYPNNTSNNNNNNNSNASNSIEQQDKLLAAMLNDDLLMQMLNAAVNTSSSSTANLLAANGGSMDKSFFNEFLQPFVNLPGALVNYGKLVRRFIRTFDPKFWSFSLDEQAQFDVTAAVDFVLKKTQKRQVALVGHSAGSALILFKLTESPEFADKVSKAVLLAPALNMGHLDIDRILAPIGDLVRAYLGAIPFPFMSQQLQGILQIVCDFKTTQYTFCETLSDLLFGFTGGQEPITPAFLANGLQPTASRELVHLRQFIGMDRPRKFKFNSYDENLKVYGSGEPPIYDLSRIRLQKMSLYAGNLDSLISPGDVRVTSSQLSVPHRFTVVGSNEIGVLFNHIGYFIHKKCNKLSTIPILKDIDHLLQ